MSVIDSLLARLDGVRSRGGNRWSCRCPAHEDRSPSMSVRQAEDGTILIRCFAGCEPNDILAAVGMNIRDLFPKHLNHRLPPKRMGISGFEAIKELRHELLVIQIIASDGIAHGFVDEHSRRRAALAADRIETALSLCDG